MEFLLRHGPRTFIGSRLAQPGRHGDGERSEPVRVCTARNALAHLPAPYRETSLVDVGCGRGRLLLVALDAGFTHVLGIESDPGHAQAARGAFKGRAGRRAQAEVVTADAATWRFPDDVGVVTLFNPFGPDTLRDMLGAMQASREREPRSVAIVYINPRDLPVVEEAGYRVEWAEEDAAILLSP